MTLDHRYHNVDAIRSTLSFVLEPIRQTIDLPFLLADDISTGFSSRTTLLDENQELRTQNLLLKTRLQKYSALESENIRLREALDSSVKVGDKVLIAELLRVDLEPFTRRIVINKGSGDDLYPGQPLLDANGVIGQILHVSLFSSTAMLITDPSHAIPVQLNSTGLRAIAIGTGQPGQLKLLHVPRNIKLKTGDLLVTSGLGGRFPAGYPVAKVTQVSVEPGNPYLQVIAAPTAALQQSREVLVVWPAAGPAAQTADNKPSVETDNAEAK